MVRILIVDDSPIVRSVFSSELKKISDFSVVGVAPDPFAARDLLVEKKPDVMLLDVEMPKMDGLIFLKKIMKYNPMPVIIVSALTKTRANLVLDAIESGAVDIIAKPGSVKEMRELAINLEEKIRGAATVGKAKLKSLINHGRQQKAATYNHTATNRIIAIGSSTGGVDALSRILPLFPQNCSPIGIVQHMPPGFTQSFSDRLNQKIPQLHIKEAESGDVLEPGKVIIAPGGKHMVLQKAANGYTVKITPGPKVNRHCPSVEVFYKSVAKIAGANAIGIIMTGMGDDGAVGLREMKKAGAQTIAQDENSCVVFGMPKEAIKHNAVDHVVSLELIPQKVVQLLDKK